jgi:hypothetical protein
MYRKLAALREENERLSGEVGDLKVQLHKTFDDWVKVRKMAIIWHKWPGEKPTRDGGYLFVDSYYKKGRSAFFNCLDTSHYENGKWDGDIEPSYWAEIPKPKDD